MANVLLNLSGHQNDALTEMGFVFPGVLHVRLDDEQLPQRVLEFLRPLMGSGDHVTVALPGLTALAAIVQSAIHGLTGQFPAVQTLIRSESGEFVPGPCYDLQLFRNEVARTQREGIVTL